MPIPYRGPWRRWAEARTIDFLRLTLVAEVVSFLILVGLGLEAAVSWLGQLRW